MLGQAHTPRRRLLSFAVFALAVLVVPSVSGANPSHSTASLRARDAAIIAESRAAVLGLYSLDQQLASSQTRLASLRLEAASLRVQRKSLRHQLTIAKRSTRISQQRLADRLRALYEQDNVEPLEIVLGARSLDEAMTNLDNLSRVTGQGEDVLRQLTSARAALRNATRGLSARQAALAAAMHDAEATAALLSRTRAERNSYISSLAAARRVTEGQLSNLVAQARAAQLRTANLTRSSFSDTASPVSPIAAVSFESAPPTVAGDRTITVSATGYALPGTTATGLPVGWGVVAVDPSLIPLGTRMTVPGYGEAVAADTGSAIVGATIDLWFPSIAQANAWGRRTVTIVLH
ncbi:MAG TPA: 3D domain-containing protein [Gaiellaceae bacterium]|nr:3D domain-containing protein [Gaiellaceae bacterium]